MISFRGAIERFRDGKCPWTVGGATKMELDLVEALSAKDERIKTLEADKEIDARTLKMCQERIALLEKVREALKDLVNVIELGYAVEPMLKQAQESLSALQESEKS